MRNSEKFETQITLKKNSTHVVVYVWIVPVVKQGFLVHFLSFLGPGNGIEVVRKLSSRPTRKLLIKCVPVHFDEDVSSVDVGLRVVGPHRNGLTIKCVRLAESRLVASDEVGEIQENVQVIGRNAGLITLTGFGSW